MNVIENELKKVKEKLKESEEKFRIITEQSNLGISIIQDDRIKYINQQLADLLGYTIEEFKSWQPREYAEVIHPDDREFVIEQGRRKQSGNDDVDKHYQVRLIKSTGEIKWVDNYSTTINYKERPAILATIIDITERKRIEEELHESEIKYRTIFAQAVDTIFIIDPETGGLIEFNNIAYENLGYTYEEFKKINISDFESIESPKEVKKHIEKILREGFDKFETKHKTKKGDIRDIHVSSRTISIRGRNYILSICRDITKRKKAEQALKESEARFKTLYKGGPIPAYTWQKVRNDFKLINYNNAAEKYTLRDVRNYLGFKASEMYKDQPDILKDLHACYNTKFNITREIKYYINILKEEKDLVARYSFIPPDLVLVHTEDITEKKKFEQELKKTEEKYRHLFVDAPISLWEEDWSEIKIYIDTLKNSGINNFRNYFESHPNEVNNCISMTKIIDLNKETVKMLKARDKNEIMENLSKIFVENTYNVFREGLIAFAEGKTSFESESSNKTLKGDLFYTNIKVAVAPEHEETLKKMQVSIIDITKLKKSEQKLKESEEKYRYIFENTRFAIILINPDGIIINCNPSTERITGYNKIELINRNFKDLSVFHEKYLNLIGNLFRKLFDGEIVHRIDVEFIKKDGSLIWVNIQASIVNIGEESFMIVLIYDIEERKRAEFLVKEELKKLKELDQIRKNLILRVSHELKTPLIPVCSGTEFLLYKYEEQLEEEVSDILKMIEKGGTRLKMLVNKLLDLSRLEYDMLSLEKQTSDLCEIIKECSNDMMHLVKSRGLTLNLDIPNNFYLDIDAMRVEQVIINLLSNAIKNTPPKGKISISLREENNWAILFVADTGVGLTKEEMSKVFTRFGKIERHDKGLEYTDIQGSGLGLFLSKEVVGLHGGKIWASSEGRNKGSTFYFSLPIIKK